MGMSWEAQEALMTALGMGGIAVAGTGALVAGNAIARAVQQGTPPSQTQAPAAPVAPQAPAAPAPQAPK
jgi:hypothetical protein